MKIFLTSDHHFFHKNIIKYTSRPFNNEYEMNEFMIKKWNNVVKKSDMVLHLGDLTAGLKGRKKQLVEVVKRLNGKIHLILGNHDYLGRDFYINECGIKSVSKYLAIGNYFFCHYPLIQDPDFLEPKKEILKENFKKHKCKYIFHGHTHNTEYPNYENHFNVGVDRNNFTPIDLEKFTETYKWQK